MRWVWVPVELLLRCLLPHPGVSLPIASRVSRPGNFLQVRLSIIVKKLIRLLQAACRILRIDGGEGIILKESTADLEITQMTHIHVLRKHVHKPELLRISYFSVP